MSYLSWAIPVALLMGLAGLGAFMWSLRSGQYEDLDGAAERVLLDDECDESMAAVDQTVSAQDNPKGISADLEVNHPSENRHTPSP